MHELFIFNTLPGGEERRRERKGGGQCFHGSFCPDRDGPAPLRACPSKRINIEHFLQSEGDKCMAANLAREWKSGTYAAASSVSRYFSPTPRGTLNVGSLMMMAMMS